MQTVDLDSKNVKIYGRHIFKDDVLYLIHSACGISFLSDTTKFVVRFLGDGTSAVAASRYSIFVDGKLILTGSPLENSKSETINVGTEKELHLIEIYKLTEAHQSYLGIAEILVDQDARVEFPAEKKFRIEFVGDSITCGYAVETQSENDVFTTGTENALKSYGWYAAKELDAEIECCSYSGFGVISGWTETGEINDTGLLPKFYEKLGFNWNHRMFENETWNPASYKKDAVVINLGTNDISWAGTEERKEAFAQAYVEFLKYLRKLNPESMFIASVGIMMQGEPMAPYVEKACRMYREETGDTKIRYLHFGVQKKEEGYGSGFHPTVKTQMRCGKQLADCLKKYLVQD